MQRIFLFLTIVGFLGACGGGGDGGGNSGITVDLCSSEGINCPAAPSASNTGRFIDAPVQGLSYQTTPGNLSGTTDGNGSFRYNPGDTVTFKVGQVVLGRATGAATITPITLGGAGATAMTPSVVNIASFLQSLDQNAGKSSTIIIPSAAQTVLADTANSWLVTNLNADFAQGATSAHFVRDLNNVVALIPGTNIVSALAAQTAMVASLTANNIPVSSTSANTATTIASTGQLMDAPVQGVTYSTPTLSGVTDSQGTFQYHTGEPVSFSVGQVFLGSTTGASVVTPISLGGPGATSATASAINIATFLQSLDQNKGGVSSIVIPSSVASALTTSNPVLGAHVSALNASNNLSSVSTVMPHIVSSVSSLYPNGATSVSASSAQNAMIANLTAGNVSLTYARPTFSSVNSGTYSGTYASVANSTGSSHDSGTWTMTINAYGDVSATLVSGGTGGSSTSATGYVDASSNVYISSGSLYKYFGTLRPNSTFPSGTISGSLNDGTDTITIEGDISGNFSTTSVATVATGISSANGTNVTACGTTPVGTGCVTVANCTDGANLMQGGLPSGYTITSLAIASKVNATCMVTATATSATATFTLTGTP
ncbi:MAG: hypothetical protein HQL63_10825 [Magnetococcales bacterium]|nr:hypothetical protein [Magnetococcales bacterium]MBF0322330.1 hypothetical protein [Magnetococcales bacterium]